MTRTRSGRTKNSVIRVLATLLDHAAFPAAEIAALHAGRWQAEIAFPHLKKTLRGARRVLRGQSEALARQEARAFLLAHNMIAALAAKAAALAGSTPARSASPPCRAWSAPAPAPVTAASTAVSVLAAPATPLRRLPADVTAFPRNRASRKRTSGRTPAERRTRHTEEATHIITITPSNLPQWDESLGS